jgi:hypothetical protein
MKQLAERAPVLEPLLAKANHVDVKTIDSAADMRTFIAGMMSYTPFWLKFLYGVRWLFVRLLGMRQEGVPLAQPLHPSDISFTPGDAATFFTVTMAEPEKYWVAEAADTHLTAYIGVVAESFTQGNRFHVVTIVHYRHWTGPVYFNVIRPFHHIVVRQMMKAGAHYKPVIGELA